MAAELIKIETAHPESAFSRCRDVVFNGGVVIYPTDTFYGLGADPSNAAAVRRVFEIKGRKADQPILLLLEEAGRVRDWAVEVHPEAGRLMKKYWPGPLTLVFRANPQVLPLLTGDTNCIGLRVPGNDLTRKLLAFLGIALTGTSANRSGMTSPSSARDAAEALGGEVDLILDGGETPGGRPSTIADVSSGAVRILRRGAVRL
jgi:L-threonylcarbamoyladenylate synthase